VGDYKSHIQFVHGVYVGDVHTVEGMVEAHEACHTPLPSGRRWDSVIIRHTHGAQKPARAQISQEWTW